MKNIIIIMLAIAAAVAIILSSCNTRKNEPSNGNPGDTLKQVTVDSIQLQWRADSAYLHVTVKAPTTGWIAVGFNNIPAMQGANLIIGYVLYDSVFVRDDYGSVSGVHDADANGGGTADVDSIAGNEGAGMTEISFRIPLDSGDARDLPLTKGSTYDLILAYGENAANDFTSYHKRRTATAIVI